ncbi:MAG: peptidoglycan DD-metalloendopeptidase family protein [Chloroflexi bacterium]|nr:peptidoglycan DD-metalloendopeptidase family protein [Chloroflexota bacterium]
MRKSTLLRHCFLLFFTLGLIFTLVGCTVKPEDGVLQQGSTQEAQLPQPKTLTDPREIELNSIIQKAAAGREDVMAFIIFRVVVDHADFSPDGNLALVWTTMVDPQTGLVQSSEPGLVIAHKTSDSTQPWTVVFQADPNFAAELQAVPDAMLSPEGKNEYMPAVQQGSKDGAVYRGYKLPWTNGATLNLTGSIGHVLTYKSCPATCLYAFDFANGTMFAVRAARQGRVKYVVWSYPNGNETNANYVILEDTTTSPTTYQVYFHFAQNTIPPELRVVGAQVVQGQYLGNADDTGYSTGNHLHFHVHTNPSSYWGNSVDIVFDEVSVNGGRPRTCSESSAFPEYGTECMSGNRYVSRNSDLELPTGTITSPAAYSTITSPTLNVSGWMKDDTAIQSGQILYNTGSDWLPIGDPITNTPFTREIDLCRARIQDGKLFLSLKITDQSGKVSTGTQGLTELTKQYACPVLPPACTPADNQVALYTDVDYQGSCRVFDPGEYDNLGNLPTSYLDNVKSIQVGVGVSALLYPDLNYGGSQELLQDGDADLVDNAIGEDNIASMKVVNRITPPQPPVLSLPSTIHASQDLTLSWSVIEGVQTRTTLTGPAGFSQSLDWQNGGSWQVGVLAEGTYVWTVEALTLAGSASTSQEFSVEPPLQLPVTHLNDLPIMVNSSAVMLTWDVDSGADGIDHFEVQTRNSGSDWLDLGETLPKDARQVLFWGTPGQTYEFRLRAVDLLNNAEEFTTLAAATTTFSESCGSDSFDTLTPGDNEFASADIIEVGVTQQHNWCPVGDVDWLSFQAEAGDQLRFTSKTVDLAAGALLTLYEPDASTFIGEARPLNASSDASLDWTVPVSGTYFIKMTPFDTRIGGSDTKYEVGIAVKSQVKPTPLICGGAAIPALLGGGYVLSKKVQKSKKKKGVGW